MATWGKGGWCCLVKGHDDSWQSVCVNLLVCGCRDRGCSATDNNWQHFSFNFTLNFNLRLCTSVLTLAHTSKMNLWVSLKCIYIYFLSLRHAAVLGNADAFILFLHQIHSSAAQTVTCAGLGSYLTWKTFRIKGSLIRHWCFSPKIQWHNWGQTWETIILKENHWRV